MNTTFLWFRKRPDLGVLLLRLFIGVRLIYGVLDNVSSWKHMLMFRDFLQQTGFEFPLLSAIISVYAQFICGFLIILGWKIRWAALVMIINFLVALFMVHHRDTFDQMTVVLMMIFIHLFFLFYGAGKYGVLKATRGIG